MMPGLLCDTSTRSDRKGGEYERKTGDCCGD